MKDMLTQSRLQQALAYDPSTGKFLWKIKTNKRIVVGSEAGTLVRGYVRIRIDGVIYAAHRLAWLYVYGRWPNGQIDHKNGKPGDNWIDNLRDATVSINRQNIHRPQRRNKLGVLGVSVTTKGSYRARVGHLHLGTYTTIAAARIAYLNAKRILHPWSTL